MIGDLGGQIRRSMALYAYLALYIALDWMSLIQPSDESITLGITPWNPAAGLSFAALLLRGPGFAPAVFVAAVVASVLFHGLSIAPLATLASAAMIAAGYAAAAAVLRSGLRISLRIENHSDLLELLAVALAATMTVAAAVVATFAVSGSIAWEDVPDVALHFWVGDMIGIAVLTPFILFVLDPERRFAPTGGRDAVEFVLQLGSIGLGLWIIFGLESTNHSEYSYVLFLPLMWIALRFGLSGATWGILATQLGLILAIQIKGFDAAVMTQFQLLMLAVAVSGLLLGSIVDERRRAESSLRLSEARLQSVVSTAPDAILTYDEAGTVTSVNRAAEQMFFSSSPAPEGVNIQTLLPGLRIGEPGAAADNELIAHRLDGSSFVAEVAVGKAMAGDRLIHVGVVRDISARKQAELWLKEHEAALAHATRLTATGEMAAALAHELNQPLTALIAFARACQTILQTDGSEAARASAAGLIDQAVRQALRAGEIIRSTRELVRRSDARFTKVEISQIFRAVFDLVRAESVLSRVSIVVRFEKGVPAVFADAIQIEQVIINVVRNAIEAMTRAEAKVREITLSARASAADPAFVEVSIRDSGPGFPPEIADRLFKPFATTKDTGMGLGLSISRSIIESHGGQIWAVPPVPGEGAEIRFTIPVHVDESSDL